MDFPIFHLDFLNNRFLIAIIAVLHVMINHALAVGGLPLVALLEWKGQKDKANEEKWDSLAYRILFVFFIITTTIGAMTGVGIWFSVSLVNPYSIGSLIRVFYWGWFTEWVVFVTEVSLILLYFLTWKKMKGKAKGKHIKLGFTLAIASWVTMAIIVAILGFMMDPGSWLSEKTFLSGFLNPIYLPQLLFRTPLAMIMGGVVSLFLAALMLRKDQDFHLKVKSFLGKWIIAWSPIFMLGSWLYYNFIPTYMKSSIGIANLTQSFSSWQNSFIYLMSGAFLFIFIVGLINGFTKRKTSIAVNLLAFVIVCMSLGHFERVREFIRKPYVIGKYMYANGLRVEDYPLLKKEGILKSSVYSKIKEITPLNEVQAGKEVFKIACSRCHTVNGINSIKKNLTQMYGEKVWDAKVIDSYIENMHEARTYMPPFPGTDQERQALSKYLVHLQAHEDYFYGDQEVRLMTEEKGKTNEK